MLGRDSKRDKLKFFCLHMSAFVQSFFYLSLFLSLFIQCFAAKPRVLYVIVRFQCTHTAPSASQYCMCIATERLSPLEAYGIMGNYDDGYGGLGPQRLPGRDYLVSFLPHWSPTIYHYYYWQCMSGLASPNIIDFAIWHMTMMHDAFFFCCFVLFCAVETYSCGTICLWLRTIQSKFMFKPNAGYVCARLVIQR